MSVDTAKFSKVSANRFVDDMTSYMNTYTEDYCEVTLSILPLPKRSTTQSAGYDFYAPVSFELKPGETIKIPTGIRCEINGNMFLALVPRSGAGMKYKVRLDNTLGVVDAR